MTKTNNKILIDADAIIAATNTGDSNHTEALSIDAYIQNHGFKKYISNLVIYEIANVLSIRASQELAIEFLESIFMSDIEIIYIDEAHTYKTIQKFKTYIKKNISFVDCSNLILMEEYSIDAIFSFDKFYKDKLFQI